MLSLASLQKRLGRNNVYHDKHIGFTMLPYHHFALSHIIIKAISNLIWSCFWYRYQTLALIKDYCFENYPSVQNKGSGNSNFFLYSCIKELEGTFLISPNRKNRKYGLSFWVENRFRKWALFDFVIFFEFYYNLQK